jgi:hypothetical protein
LFWKNYEDAKWQTPSMTSKLGSYCHTKDRGCHTKDGKGKNKEEKTANTTRAVSVPGRVHPLK